MMTATTRIGIVVITALICLGTGARLANVGNVKSRSPDELVYTLQAKHLFKGRQAALKSLIAEYQRDAVVRGFPAPTRLGYLVPLATAMGLSGETDEQVGRYLSCAASVGSLFLVGLIGLRFFPLVATLFALLLYAVSPMELAIARRAWTDALLEFLGLALVYLAAEITRSSKRWTWYLLFVVIGSMGIAVKETGVISYGLCAIWILWVLCGERREWANGLILIFVGALGLGIAIGWLALSVGGINVLVKVVMSIFTSNAVNAYAVEYQSGPGYLLLWSLAVMSPIAALFSLTGSGVLLLSHRRVKLLHFPEPDADWSVIRWIALLCFAYLAWPMLLPRCLNLRYISFVFGIYYLIAGVGFWYLWSLSRHRLNGIAWRVIAGFAIVVLSFAAITDYLRFQRLFVRADLQDLAVNMVLDPDNPRNAIHVSAPVSPVLEPTPVKTARSQAEAEEEAREGDALLRQGQISEAMPHYENALELEPDLVATLNNFAWLLSTAPEASQRNGRKALELAEKAVRLGSGENPVHLRTLAAAYAENGRFDEAIATAERARQFAETQQNATLVQNLSKDLYFYQRNHPLHR